MILNLRFFWGNSLRRKSMVKKEIRGKFILNLSLIFLLTIFSFPAFGQDIKPEEFSATGAKAESSEKGKPATSTEKPVSETPPNPEEAPGAPPSESPAEQAEKVFNPAVSVGDEAEQAQIILDKYPYKLAKEKDPFRPLIDKPMPIVMQSTKPVLDRPILPNTPPAPPPPPPLKLIVQGIVGNDAERLAMIFFENELIVVKKDEEVKGKFKVVDILPDKVVIYSNKEQMRRKFPIGGGKE